MNRETNTDRIRKQIQSIFDKAQSSGFSSIDIRAGDLHESVEFVDGTHPNQMPSCCNMMYEVEKFGDKRVVVPTKGRGANLLIKYKIPR